MWTASIFLIPMPYAAARQGHENISLSNRIFWNNGLSEYKIGLKPWGQVPWSLHKWLVPAIPMTPKLRTASSILSLFRSRPENQLASSISPAPHAPMHHQIITQSHCSAHRDPIGTKGLVYKHGTYSQETLHLALPAIYMLYAKAASFCNFLKSI